MLRIFPVGPAATRSSAMNYLWAPGQHIYLSIPSTQPLACHPFTVLSSGMVAPPLSTPQIHSPSNDDENEKHERSEESSVVGESRSYIDIALVPRAGITKGLAKRLGGTDGGKEMTVFVDGPYGPSLDVSMNHPLACKLVILINHHRTHIVARVVFFHPTCCWWYRLDVHITVLLRCYPP